MTWQVKLKSGLNSNRSAYSKMTTQTQPQQAQQKQDFLGQSKIALAVDQELPPQQLKVNIN